MGDGTETGHGRKWLATWPDSQKMAKAQLSGHLSGMFWPFRGLFFCGCHRRQPLFSHFQFQSQFSTCIGRIRRGSYSRKGVFLPSNCSFVEPLLRTPSQNPSFCTHLLRTLLRTFSKAALRTLLRTLLRRLQRSYF